MSKHLPKYCIYFHSEMPIMTIVLVAFVDATFSTFFVIVLIIR